MDGRLDRLTHGLDLSDGRRKANHKRARIKGQVKGQIKGQTKDQIKGILRVPSTNLAFYCIFIKGPTVSRTFLERLPGPLNPNLNPDFNQKLRMHPWELNSGTLSLLSLPALPSRRYSYIWQANTAHRRSTTYIPK